jgi:hypothetical protein
MLISAIKIGRYTHEKRTRDIKEIKRSKSHDLSLTGESDLDISDTEMDSLVETLIQIQEECNADFRQCFKPGALLEMQRSVYV